MPQDPEHGSATGPEADVTDRGRPGDIDESAVTDRTTPPPRSPSAGRASKRPGSGSVLRRGLWLAAAFALGLAIGFVPQWLTSRDLRGRLDEATHRLEVARLQSALGAALAEVEAGEYERARQLASSFYTGLDALEGEVRDEAQALVLADIALGRDQMITLLSRADPEARGRLAAVYSRYFAAMEPVGPERPGPATQTPAPGAQPERPPSGEGGAPETDPAG